jgi:hypothetical protein
MFSETGTSKLAVFNPSVFLALNRSVFLTVN